MFDSGVDLDGNIGAGVNPEEIFKTFFGGDIGGMNMGDFIFKTGNNNGG